jgi:pimeloyl-ACP methyl ester carboxylesterase
MNARVLTFGLALAAVCTMGVALASCPPGGPTDALVRREYLSLPGYVEPHTPGSGAVGVEVPTTTKVQQILGPTPNLNQVSYARFSLPRPDPSAKPRIILILVPGFLSGAGPFTPLAQQLVLAFGGNLEVWVIDRRPNQLEDLRGALYAQSKLEQTPPDLNGFLDGIQFYFPDQPGVDVNGNGIQDPPFALPDALGGTSPFRQLDQNDARFMAYWGIDTYVRDWKMLVDMARAEVGAQGLVLFGGHSMGTQWAGVFAAYDFDPGPGVEAGYKKIDGMLLLDLGGPRAPAANLPTHAAYVAAINTLATSTLQSDQVFLPSFSGASLSSFGAAAEIGGLDASFRPGLPALLQRTALFQSFPLDAVVIAPLTTETMVALFLDNNTSPVAELAGSFGFSDDGPNSLFPAVPSLGIFSPFYLLHPRTDGQPRQWKNYNDPTLPRCPPFNPDPAVDGGPGCVIKDLGPRPGPTDPPSRWGLEAQVSDLDDMIPALFQPGNFIEWYFGSGRTNLDFEFGRDSSALGDESLLAVTQNANVNVPVLCIGGSNGLAPTEASFSDYLNSIATPAADKQIFIAEGYAHLDVIMAKNNAAVPQIVSWMSQLLQRKLLASP